MSSKRKTDPELSPSPKKRVTRSNKDSNILTVVDHHEIPENLKLWAWDVKSTEKKKRYRDYDNDTSNNKRRTSKTTSKKETKTPKKDNSNSNYSSKDVALNTNKTPVTSNKKINLKSTTETSKSVIKETKCSNQSAFKVTNSDRKKTLSDSIQKLSKFENVIDTNNSIETTTTTVTGIESTNKNKGTWSIMDYLMIIIFYIIINYALFIRSKNISLRKM